MLNPFFNHSWARASTTVSIRGKTLGHPHWTTICCALWGKSQGKTATTGVLYYSQYIHIRNLSNSLLRYSKSWSMLISGRCRVMAHFWMGLASAFDGTTYMRTPMINYPLRMVRDVPLKHVQKLFQNQRSKCLPTFYVKRFSSSIAFISDKATQVFFKSVFYSVCFLKQHCSDLWWWDILYIQKRCAHRTP